MRVREGCETDRRKFERRPAGYAAGEGYCMAGNIGRNRLLADVRPVQATGLQQHRQQHRREAFTACNASRDGPRITWRTTHHVTDHASSDGPRITWRTTHHVTDHASRDLSELLYKKIITGVERWPFEAWMNTHLLKEASTEADVLPRRLFIRFGGVLPLSKVGQWPSGRADFTELGRTWFDSSSRQPQVVVRQHWTLCTTAYYSTSWLVMCCIPGCSDHDITCTLWQPQCTCNAMVTTAR